MHRAWAKAPARGLSRDIHGDKAPGHRYVHDRKHPRTTECHSAGSPPASQVHLRRPFSPARSPGHRQCPPCPFCSTLSKPFPPRRPWRRGLAWADLQPSTRAQCAAQEGIDASDHLPESTMGSTSRDRPSATDPRPRNSIGDERPPEDAPVVIPRTAAYAGWIPLRPTIRRDQLRQIVPLADTTIYDMERRGEFPRRFQLTSRCVVWDLREVEAWIESRRQASDLAQIKRAPPPDVRQRRSRPVRSTPAS